MLAAAVGAGLGVMALPRSRVPGEVTIWEDAPLPKLADLFCGIHRREGGDRALLEQPVYFVFTGGGQTHSAASTTSFLAGRATAPALVLPAGTYNVTAAFGGVVALGNGQTVTAGSYTHLELPTIHSESHSVVADYLQNKCE